MRPSVIVQPSATAQWQSLIQEAEAKTEQKLNEELESYLVFLLMRFTQKPELVRSVFAIEYLESSHTAGQTRRDALRDIGDKCLIFSGFFPSQAEKRHVSLQYFIKLGQGAYGSLAEQNSRSWQHLFATLASEFVSLMDILHAMKNDPNPSPLSLFHVWEETQSAYAEKQLDALFGADQFYLSSDRSRH